MAYRQSCNDQTSSCGTRPSPEHMENTTSRTLPVVKSIDNASKSLLSSSNPTHPRTSNTAQPLVDCSANESPKGRRGPGRKSAWWASEFKERGRGLSCRHCGKEFGPSCQATRQKRHLAVCLNIPRDLKRRIETHDSEIGPNGSSRDGNENGHVYHQKKLKLESLTGGGRVSKKEIEAIDKALISFIAASGISFNVTQNPFFLKFLSALRRKYDPPSPFRLSGTLLNELYEDVSGKVDAAVRHAGISRCGTICFDGWKNVNENHVVNVLFKIGSQSFFIQSIATGFESVNAEKYSQILFPIVERLGGTRAICGVASDNTQSCVNGKDIIVSKYPSIFALQDTPHVADLLIKDSFTRGAFKKCLKGCVDIRKGVRCNQYLLSLYRTVKDEYNRKIKGASAVTAVDIPSYPETRFAYAVLVMRAVHRSKQALRNFVESKSFDSAAESARKSEPGRTKIENLIRTVEDGVFWRYLGNLKKCGEPLSTFVHYFEREDARIGEVYPMSLALMREVEKFDQTSMHSFTTEELAFTIREQKSVSSGLRIARQRYVWCVMFTT